MSSETKDEIEHLLNDADRLIQLSASGANIHKLNNARHLIRCAIDVCSTVSDSKKIDHCLVMILGCSGKLMEKIAKSMKDGHIDMEETLDITETMKAMMDNISEFVDAIKEEAA